MQYMCIQNVEIDFKLGVLTQNSQIKQYLNAVGQFTVQGERFKSRK